MKTSIGVVYLLTYLDSQTGGMERQALQLARHLREMGHEIFFITCAYRDRMRREKLRLVDVKDGFPVYRIPLFKGARYFNRALYAVGALLLLLVTRKRYQIIHAHQLYTSGVIAAFAKLFLRSKKLIVKNCCGGEFSDVKFLRSLIGSRWIMRRMRNVADRWIAISDETRQEMEAERFGPIVDIPNGVDTAYFEPADAELKLTLRGNMNIPPQEKIVLFVGKFDPQKNILMLLEALCRVKQKVHLMILGDGPLRPVLERQVMKYHLSDKVTFFGIVEDVKRYYQVADVFVLPSRAEGLSNVLLEAMSCGLPVIASDIEGNRFLVKHDLNGYLAPPGNATALALAIDYILNHPEEARRLGHTAHKTIIQRFSLDSVVQSYATLYRSLDV